MLKKKKNPIKESNNQSHWSKPLLVSIVYILVLLKFSR